MPLDSLNFVPAAERIATPAEFWTASSRERLAMLAFALRHVPQTHQWDFARVGGREGCGSAGCALGLAHVLWDTEGGNAGSVIADALPVEPSFRIFGVNEQWAMEEYGVPRLAVDAAMVAEALDAYLARA